jgi:hypothetical protein
MSTKDRRRWFLRLLAFTTLLVVSATVSGMPPNREGPSWAHHNRAASRDGTIGATRIAPIDQSPPVVSPRAKVAPLPDREGILQQMVSTSDPSRIRVIVDLESAEKGIYFVHGNERAAIPIEIRGERRTTPSIDNEFIARAAYTAMSQSKNHELAEALLVDYAHGQIEIVRDGQRFSTSPAKLPAFAPVITELTEPADRARVATN